jgi:hypothetical protein
MLNGQCPEDLDAMLKHVHQIKIKEPIRKYDVTEAIGIGGNLCRKKTWIKL